MDVKYIPSDWERMKDGIGDLIGLGRWGKGMIDELKDLSDNLEDAESDIAKYDSDGVISFRHTSLKSKYQALYEDFQVLHRFSGKVGDIVERTIDQPFYEDMDAFVAAMQEASISNYTTKNRIGATETQYVYGGYGPAQALTVPKTEVSLDDIFSGDNFYGKQMQLEYEAWKEMNPDQDYTREEYQMGVVNTRAFEYESIRSQQESKEFWVQLGAMVVIVGTTLLCPPAGIALGVAYGAMELGSAVSGKDWVSGRELGTGERWFRGLLAPLDIIPGVGAIAKFGSAARLARVGDQVGQIGLTSGIRSGFRQGVAQVDNLVRTASRETMARLKSANAAVKDAANVVKNKLAKDIIEVGDLIDSGITTARNAFQLPQSRLVMADVGDIGRVSANVENSHTVGNKMRDVLSRIDGVNLAGTARGAENANRLIPGTPGNPTSGDPTKLGKNLLESMGLPRSTSWKGYQAQHIIPSQLNKHPVIKKIGMEMNDFTNGIFLPIPSDDVSGLSRHRGFHSVYNNVVRKQLDKMDVNQDIVVLEKQVYELQQKLKKGVEIGLPLYKTKINNIGEFYKSGQNKKLPVWNRGGGATEELWERWLSK
jgi:hypothetical protein